jgi:hypothetical protein
VTDARVIDTNVLMVADGRADQADPDCVLACVDALQEAKERGLTLIDADYLILDEYRRGVGLGSRRAGGVFLKWLWDNQANQKRCLRVSLTPRGPDGDFAEFPADPALQTFDPDDRKFVAVAVSSGLAPPILNASDTDWWHHREALARNAVILRFLCEDLMSGEP